MTLSDTATRLRRRSPALPVWRVGKGVPPSGAFVALVPGEDAPLMSLVLPGTLKGAAREDVARRQAADRLGSHGAALDIRPARLTGGDGWTRVAVADRTLVQRWRKALGAAAGRCRALLPDYLALPTAAGLWSIDAEDDILRVRLGPQDGFSAEPALALAMLSNALHDAAAANTAPRVVLLTGPGRASVIPHLHGVAIASSPGDLPPGLEPVSFGVGDLSVDFARDPRADAEAVEHQIRRLFWPVLLVVAGALGWAGAVMLETGSDRTRADALRAETRAAVRRDVLPTGPILDLRVQVARAIADRQAGTVPETVALNRLDLLRRAAPVLAGSEAEVQALAYGAADNGVTVELTLDSFRALDALTDALRADGLTVAVERSGTEEGGGIAATLRLTGGTP